MTRRVVSISLKIPDNTAYTALVALRRLGVEVARIERSAIWFFDDEGDVETLVRRIIADERIFNPNKHRLSLLEDSEPRAGEVWIEPLEVGKTRHAIVNWRLMDGHGRPVDRSVLLAAVNRLLCNPAVERATY